MGSTTETSDPTNRDQARAWDGDEGAYWAANHERFEAALERYQPAFLAVAAVEPGHRVLDVGCGTGASTRAAATAAYRGHALGIDLSSDMVAVARRLADRAGLANITFERADAQIHPFPAGGFDVVISRTGAMFFGRPDVAFANLWRSLAPGGRLVLLTWQSPDHQEWLTAFSHALTGRKPPPPGAGGSGPFSLSDPGRVRALLGGAGFTDIALTPVAETTTYGRTVEEAHTFLLGLLDGMLRDQDAQQRAESVSALHRVLEDHATADGVRFGSAAWLITAQRPRSSRNALTVADQGGSVLLSSFEVEHAAVVGGWATSAQEVSLLCGRETFPFPAELLTSWPQAADDIRHYLLLDGGTPIGYGELWLDEEEDEVELARIIVAPEHRGRGLGIRLVRALLAEALTAGLSNVFLRVRPDNQPAIRTYERVGFRSVDAALAAEWNAPQPVDYAWFQYPVGEPS